MGKDKGTGFAGRCGGLTRQILGAAFDVHARLGPGLLESAYRCCLVHKLRQRDLAVETEVPIAIQFDGLEIATAYRADIIVNRKVLLELKATDSLSAIHCMQTRTYLNHSGMEVALLINFNMRSLADGIRRFDRRRPPCTVSRPSSLP